MALADVFYPDNPRKRQKVVQLSAKLATLLESNFKRTNDLIDCIHRYIPGRTFRKVKVNQDKSIRDNCRVIQGRIQEIQAYLEEKAREIRRNVDSSLFDRLMSTDISFVDRVRLARNICKVGELVLSVASVVVVSFILKGTILVGISASIGVVAAAGFAGIAFAVLILGIDAIFSAFIGYYERSRLEQAIKDLEEAIRSFEPASDKYNREIERLIIRIEDHFER